jgi:hypothetical protein
LHNNKTLLVSIVSPDSFPVSAVSPGRRGRQPLAIEEAHAATCPAVGGKNRPFSGFSKCKKVLDATLEEVTPYTLHDLRRTFSTNIAKVGIAPHIKEALINHVSAKSEVEAIYDQYGYVPEMKSALELWERYFL